MAMDRTVVLLLLLFFLVSEIATSAQEQRSDSVPATCTVEKSWLRVAADDAPSPSPSPFILAAERTQRKDPFNGFKVYTGGWNISDVHYWSSVAYTGFSIFVIAAIWFVIFGLALVFTCCYYCCCCCRSKSNFSTTHVISLVLITLLAGAAVVGSAVLYVGQGKFHGSIASTLDFVVSQMNDILTALGGFSKSLASAKNIGVYTISLPHVIRSKIDSAVTKIHHALDTFSSRTSSNLKRIRYYLDKTGLALIIVSAVMLGLVLLGLISSLLGIRCLAHTLVFLGWLIVTATLVLSGIFLLLHNVVADTCVGMDEWVLHPQEHTALDDILPCVDADTTSESLSESKQVTYLLVLGLDKIITKVSNDDSVPSFYNQSGPLMPLLCNPYHQNMTTRACLPGEVELSNATEAWRSFVCQTSDASGEEMCTTAGRVTPTLYSQMTAAANVSNALHEYGPFLADLANCSFVRQTFGSISSDHCPDLRLYSHQVFVGLALASAAVMLSLVCWVVHAGERSRGRSRMQAPFQAHKDLLPFQKMHLLRTQTSVGHSW